MKNIDPIFFFKKYWVKSIFDVQGGIAYSDTDHARSMEQNEFCQKLKPTYIPKERAFQDSSPLTPAEVTSFRQVLGALIWLCQTRLDLVCDVVLHQQETTRATIGTLKTANAIITRAKK